jgi:hypothetical protein
MTPDDKDAVLDLARANLARANLTPDELPADMEARTPAPEGEAWRHVSQEEMAQAAKFASTNLASPVVPVGVRGRVLDELDKAWLHGQRRTSWRRDEAADAIIAALRPTDTGGE